MSSPTYPVFIGDTPQRLSEKAVRGDSLTLMGERFYRIHHFDAMEPFFMSIVSSSNHWLFISSSGGLSAGRATAEHALFPYYTEDKLTENAENTGNKALLRVRRADRVSLWEPFSGRQMGSYDVNHSLYKNETGTALVFEAHNLDLNLIYRYAWRTSEKFGFVKTTWLINAGAEPCQVEVLDGLQNLMPANVTLEVQGSMSCLLDAYKRSELEPSTGLGIFALNATLSDLAEPSESLYANTVAQIGLSQPNYLLSSVQLDRFRAGQPLIPETDVRGRRGAYFVHTQIDLRPQEHKSWHLIADVYQDSASIVQKVRWLQGDTDALIRMLEDDIAAGQAKLWELVASVDGVQLSKNDAYAPFHFANVMFNAMRGGLPVDQYWLQSADFVDFVSVRNKAVLKAHGDFFASLPKRIHLAALQKRARESGIADLIRLSNSYLPLTFSRRHGDPSRPWNRFAINIKKADGSPKLDYEGNWRDIFQNWEALAYTYPEFVESMISIFVNATTADGYNPYRITRAGLDWETPEPSNPWANIGYWSDHQIIYLLKLLEISQAVHPGTLQEMLTAPVFSHARVPYRIKPYAELLKDYAHTIEFDWELHRQIEARQREWGTDARLMTTVGGQVLHITLAEKLLILLLAKLANFVPEGGIWMNTQRPEWNDANNALVGKGISVVTLGYLRRYLVFCRDLFAQSALKSLSISEEVWQLLGQIGQALEQFAPLLKGVFSDEQRRQMMDRLGEAASGYRHHYYHEGFSGEQVNAPLAEIITFLDAAQRHVEHALRANKRPDDLYHAYNVIHFEDGRAAISRLYEMLEGQVSILSSGMLSAEESLALLQSMRQGPLYRADQHTYILYPDRELPTFLEKNSLSPDQVKQVSLFSQLAEAGDKTLITRDLNGVYHFSAPLRNFRDAKRALDTLKQNPKFSELVEREFESIRALFEETFHHNQFTGRSGTFFAYEGLGSIYWHMVTKLLLAVQETALRFKDHPSAPALAACYADIRAGLSFNKTPNVYGAFPSDPYSHTPKGQGARQPGMTGSVKELILTRQGELGFVINNGEIRFETPLLDPHEWLTAPVSFAYLQVDGKQRQIELQPGTLGYTICQTPVVLKMDSAPSITIHYHDGTTHQIKGTSLDQATSRHLFQRDGRIQQLTVAVVSRGL
ncbi:MAG: hypothetical protein IAE83_15965 [Anaerolinea sp.]|nr:hypothetical protein [Anaerolinea sp.]